MENYISECLDELVSSEKFSSFYVVERFCDQCGDFTPHHIEDETSVNIKKIADNLSTVSPISSCECVYCKEEEEQFVLGVDH